MQHLSMYYSDLIAHSKKIAELYSIVRMYHSLFIHSPIKRHLVFYQFLAFINITAINICIHVFLDKFSDQLGKYLGEK